MSIYKKIAKVGPKFIARNALFKHGFNWSPMYRRSTGRVIEVSPDLTKVRVKIPISWKNKNYVNSIFGGSMFSAVDPIPMVQLLNLIGDSYVVWDKSAKIRFKKPAREHLYADFLYSEEELEEIRKEIAEKKETIITKKTSLTNKDGTIIFCEVSKDIYIADKAYYKSKRSCTQ
ncbi:MAG: PaaI family thioesterase [Flavobacteriaceae bacterium]